MYKYVNNPALLPANAALIDQSMGALQEARAGRTREERRDALKAAAASEKAAREYASLRKEVVNISMLPTLIASEIFELIPLGADENVLIYTQNDAEYSVRVVDHHGMAPKDMWVFPDTQNTYYPYEIETDTIFYPTSTISQGNLDANERVNKDLEFSYENKIDLDAWNLWMSIFDTFPAGTYSLHSRIDSGNMPTTNVIDKTSEGSITTEVIKAILRYATLIGRRVRTIYVSPQDLPDIWDWAPVTLSSGSEKSVINESLHTQVQTSGDVNQMFGYNLNWRTLNTLETGTLYVTFDAPAGRLYFKPDFEEVELYTARECRAMFKKKNHEAVYMGGVILPLITAPERLNSLKVEFVSG